ncbi:MAG: zinc ribbon domain-containing protein [Candidatus Delongbacteria bacterium]|nr:zinc ribbon domain-containing protein [Candidatus Delongbacteria bacterium]
MPSYTYKCLDCGHEYSLFQKMTDEPHSSGCPICDGSVRRQIGAGAGLVFKGSGFYVTDYKRKEQGTATIDTAGDKCQSCKAGKESCD